MLSPPKEDVPLYNPIHIQLSSNSDDLISEHDRPYRDYYKGILKEGRARIDECMSMGQLQTLKMNFRWNWQDATIIMNSFRPLSKKLDKARVEEDANDILYKEICIVIDSWPTAQT